MRKALSLLLSLIGLFDSFYLLWVYTSPLRPLACLGTGCDVVRASPYARLMGLPTPFYGVVAYAVLALLLLAEPFVPPPIANRFGQAVKAISGAGFLFSLYLTRLEAFVLHAWCVWCVVSTLAMTLIFALALFARRGPSPSIEGEPPMAQGLSRVVVLCVAVLIGIPAFYALSRRKELPAVGPPSAQTLRERLVRPDSHATGNPQAELTVVEFGDFECPACGQEEQVAEEIRARYGDRVRFVFRQYPLIHSHERSQKAAEAAECAAEQGKFWEAVSKLYTWQNDLGEDALKRYAAQLGLDTGRFNQCLDGRSMAGRVKRDLEDGVALGVRVTPTFFIGQTMYKGYMPLDQFSQTLDRELFVRGMVSVPTEKPAPGAPAAPRQ